MPLRPVAAALAAAVAVLAPASPSHTSLVDDPRWTVQPSSVHGPVGGRTQFVYDLSPGEQVVDYVGVSNLGTAPLTVAVYPTDAFNAPDGAFALLTAAEKPRDVGSWVTLAAREFTVPVGKRLDIPFKLSVPADAPPGDHAGGVVTSVKVEESTQDGQRVLVDRRIATRLYLRVAGPVRPSVDITAVRVSYANPLNPFSGGSMTVTYRVRNGGNVRVTGTARVAAAGPFGLGATEAEDATVPELLPGSEITLTRTVDGVFPSGRLVATVTVDAATRNERLSPVTQSASVWAVPWLLVALVALVLAIAVVLVVRRRARRRVGPPMRRHALTTVR